MVGGTEEGNGYSDANAPGIGTVCRILDNALGGAEFSGSAGDIDRDSGGGGGGGTSSAGGVADARWTMAD